MIKIDTSPAKYFSYLDEKSFFEWAQQIPCVTSIDDGYFHIKSKRLSESDLRDLIAIMHRYNNFVTQKMNTGLNPRALIGTKRFLGKANKV
jgi:hypothetical protein